MVGGAEAEILPDLAQPAYSNAQPFGRVVTAIGDVSRIDRERGGGEVLQTVRFEHLIADVQRHADGVMPVHFHGKRRRDEHLLEVHAGTRSPKQRDGLEVRRVHAPVAVHGYAQGHI